MSASREGLNPAFVYKLDLFEANLRAAGIHAEMTEGWRSDVRQAKLYAQGRTMPGPRVTNAKPGQTPHTDGMAADYVPVVDGRRTYKVSAIWWAKFGMCARKAELDWGGFWKRFVDRPHVQAKSWKQRV